MTSRIDPDRLARAIAALTDARAAAIRGCSVECVDGDGGRRIWVRRPGAPPGERVPPGVTAALLGCLLPREPSPHPLFAEGDDDAT